jgi:multiple sugar transport system substrate-binding protein
MKKFVTATAAGLILASAALPATSIDVSAASKRTTITFWHAMNGQNQSVLNDLIDKFNKSQKKYTVKATAQGDYSTLQQKFMAAAKSKKLPVMAQSAYSSVPVYVKNGLISPMDSYVNASGKKAISKMYKAFTSTTKYNGKFYSVPFAKSLRVMVYNQDILDKYGLSVPKSWEDIQKDAPILAKDGIAAVGFDQSFGQELQSMAKAAGVNFVDGQSKKYKAHFNSKKVVAAATVITDMLNKGEALTAGADKYGTASFAAGKTAVYFASSAGLPTIASQMPEGMNWSTTTLPSYKGKVATLVGGNDLVMSSGATKSQKAGAWAFMKYLISKDATTEWAEGTGYLPLTKEAVNSDSYQAALKKYTWAKGSTDSLKYAFAAPVFPNYDAVWAYGADQVDSMITEKTAPKVALTKIQKEAKKLIKEGE